MAFTKVRGLRMRYEVVGDRGPWVALVTGGRRGYDEFAPLAGRIARHGFRVVLHDRRNTGATDIVIDGELPEETLWLDDLLALLAQLNATPAFIGGSSAGARTAMRFYLRHPAVVKGLLLMRVTGGAFAAGRLPGMYYGQFIKLAREGGMAAVCGHEQYQERIAANPPMRERLMAMPVEHYIAVMTRWMDAFVAGTHLPIMGMTEAELASIKVPTVVIPGNDLTHASASGILAAKLIPGSRLHLLPITDQDVALIPYPEWEPLEDEIAQVFVDHMRSIPA
ncbi:MAG: alpha/beta fold hydrolase [Betaproteobacteria bacterium]